MANSTSIEWTDATWNPVTGCTKISAGCDNCYAERFSERFRGTPGHPFETGFDLTLRPERIEQPLRWREPRMIFVNSMSDLFHKGIPSAFISRVCDTMERAHWHTFQVLTKRSSLMRNFLRRRYKDGHGPNHIWFGVSVEDGTKLSRVWTLEGKLPPKADLIADWFWDDRMTLRKTLITIDLHGTGFGVRKMSRLASTE